MSADHRIPEQVVDAARSRLPLSTIAQRFTELKRAGAGEWKGRCPFHDERSPSFVVYDDHFHCFGCGEHGDAITLLTRLSGMTFGEAVRTLLGSEPHGSSPSPSAKGPPTVRPCPEDGG